MHLAHANAAVMLTSYEDPLMTDFVAELDSVNAAADAAPGFVWRFDEDDGNDDASQIFGIDKLLFNMSVWESIDALEAYTYSGRHLDVVRKRGKWFETPARSPLVLWWIEPGHIPTVEEARDRFHRLWNDGPTPEAFTFATRFEL